MLVCRRPTPSSTAWAGPTSSTDSSSPPPAATPAPTPGRRRRQPRPQARPVARDGGSPCETADGERLGEGAAPAGSVPVPAPDAAVDARRRLANPDRTLSPCEPTLGRSAHRQGGTDGSTSG